MVQPLVKKTCAGENTAAVIGGQDLRFLKSLIIKCQFKGVLVNANQMLNLMVNRKREGFVDLLIGIAGMLWYCTVDDVLRSASEVFCRVVRSR